MSKRLDYRVYCETNGKVEQYNIFKHSAFIKSLLKMKGEYIKELRNFIKKNELIQTDFIDEAAITAFKEKYRKEVFSEKLVQVLRYYFWARCEYEVIITDWPTCVTKKEVDRLQNEFKNTTAHRAPINLEVAHKIDIYDQISMNYKLFEDYVWNNLAELEENYYE